MLNSPRQRQVARRRSHEKQSRPAKPHQRRALVPDWWIAASRELYHDCRPAACGFCRKL